MPGTKAFDWSRFVVRININASIEKIYRAWASRAGMESWFLRMSEYSRANGSLRAADELTEKNDQYRWRWFGWPDDMTESGSILEANGINYFKFSFGSAGNCAISIHKEEGETIVELMQDEIPTTDHGRHNWHLGCKTGWTFYFANLKSLLEGGIDLRNKNEQLKRMINS
ncbi:MAG: SRPBCC domain-containing protein [Ferruginibacter sp.]